MQVDPIKPKLKPPGTKRLKVIMIYCFRLLLSSSACATTSMWCWWMMEARCRRLKRISRCGGATWEPVLPVLP